MQHSLNGSSGIEGEILLRGIVEYLFIPMKLFKVADLIQKNLEVTLKIKIMTNTWEFTGRIWRITGKILEFCDSIKVGTL